MSNHRSPSLQGLFLLVAIASCGKVTPSNLDAGGGTGSGGAGSGGDGGSVGTGGASATGGATGSGGGSGTGGVTGSGGSTGTGGTTGGGGRDGGATCDCGAFTNYRSCCGDRCLNLHNDPLNCGACGNKCPTDLPYCDNSVCGKAPCTSPTCERSNCCGGACCQPNQICCSIDGPISSIGCHTPTADQPGCPPGCAPLCISDRNLKRAIAPVDAQQILAKVSKLPISTWQYLSDPEDVRHLGPMAQDFKQAFGLGDTDRAYHSVDGHGVALASIQALARLAEEQKQRIDLLQRQNAALERRLRLLENQRR